MLCSRHPGEAQRGDITCWQLTSTTRPHRRRPRFDARMLPSSGWSQPGASRQSVRRPVLRSCRPERRPWRPISVVVGLERAGRSWFHRGRAACGADRGQNVSSRFFSKCGYQLFRFWSDHGMGPPVRDRASQVHRCVRRRGRRRRHHHCPTTDAGTTSYGNAFAERWIGPGRECLSPHHMIGFSPQRRCHLDRHWRDTPASAATWARGRPASTRRHRRRRPSTVSGALAWDTRTSRRWAWLPSAAPHLARRSSLGQDHPHRVPARHQPPWVGHLESRAHRPARRPVSRRSDSSSVMRELPPHRPAIRRAIGDDVERDATIRAGRR